MASKFQVGQRVRINERYGDVGGSEHVGKEFQIAAVIYSPSVDSYGERFDYMLLGDPMKRGVWENFADAALGKADTITVIHTKLAYQQVDRTVRITSGKGGLGLIVSPTPAEYGNTYGTTSLTPDQAEEIASDLLARVAEIRGAQ